MHLIVDSGSTKSSWYFVDEKGEILRRFKTMGLNPYFHSSDFIKSKLWESDDALVIRDEVQKVWFYGAGCSSPRLNQIVEKGLKEFFLSASVKVEHDLVSSSYAVYDGKPVISCILGTGSNTVLFDGERLREEVPSLAYILGDEGSGCYFGKLLVRDFYYKKLPDEVWQAFNSEFRLSDKDIIKKVYSEKDPNVFLSGFMPFISEHQDNLHIKKMLIDGFRAFIDFHVKCYSNWNRVDISFVGSIANHFQTSLKEACALEGIENPKVVEHPIEALIQYHVKYLF